MTSAFPRILLLIAAVVLAFDGLAHAYLYGEKVLNLALKSNLPPLIGKEMGALWVWDAFVLVTLAAIFLAVAVRPAAASGLAVMLIAVIPISLAGILTRLVGLYFPVYSVGGSGVLAFAAGAIFWRSTAR